jgi:hypothetical protein
MRVSPGIPRGEYNYFGSSSERDTGFTRMTGGFYKPHLRMLDLCIFYYFLYVLSFVIKLGIY